MKLLINGMTIEGTASEMRELGILNSDKTTKSCRTLARRGRPKDPTSRSAKAMKLIGMPDGTTYANLQKGSKEQKNFWRAIEYLRGNVNKLNLIG